VSTSIDQLTQSLQTVSDPIFQKSLLDLGLLEGIELSGSVGKLTVKLSSPAETYRDRLEHSLNEAAAAVGVGQLEITWDLQIPTRSMGNDDPVPDVRNVVLVTSGKGGVGKSTCSVNLALAAALGGARVGLLDADIYGPSIPTMMGIMEHPSSKDGKLIEPLESHGIKLMSIGFMLEDPRAAVVWRGPMLHNALQQFLNDVNWGPLDYLFLDLPPGTGDVALTMAQRVRLTGAVIVTTPQEVALADVYKAVSMCHKLNIPILGVIENMSYFVDTAGVKHELFGRGGGEKVAEFAKAPLLGQVPIDPMVREAGDAGVPVVKSAPASPIGKALRAVSDTLTERIAQEHFRLAGSDKAPPTTQPTRLRIVR